MQSGSIVPLFTPLCIQWRLGIPAVPMRMLRPKGEVMPLRNELGWVPKSLQTANVCPGPQPGALLRLHRLVSDRSSGETWPHPACWPGWWLLVGGVWDAGLLPKDTRPVPKCVVGRRCWGSLPALACLEACSEARGSPRRGQTRLLQTAG